MIFTISNPIGARTTAVIAMAALITGVIAPMAANAQVIVDPAPACTVITSSNNPVDNAVPTYKHPVWTNDITGARWIWSTATVTNPTIEETQSFSQDFIWGGDTITNLDFQFAADNGYIVKLNGTTIGSKVANVNDDNHSNVTQLTISSSTLIRGENTLDFEITNLATPSDSNPENNPAGFIFKFIIDGTGTDCRSLPPVDQCTNLDGMQTVVPRGYTERTGICTPITITEGTTNSSACVVRGENLLSNGSFEAEVADANVFGAGFYEVFTSITGWTSTAGFELWNNMFGGPNVGGGAQNAELDVNEPTTISQSVPTVAGNEYQVTFDFSPRSGGNAADNKVEVAVGSVLGSVSADGSAYTANVWTTHNFQFTATNTSSLLELRDKGVTTVGEGTLIDNVKVCLIKDNAPVEPDTYEIFGFVWDDTDEDDVKEDGEGNLEGWTVRATQQLVEGEPLVFSDTTDAAGRYSLFVPAGTWVVEQLTEEGWTLLSVGNNGDGTYVVVVPVPEEVSELSFLNWLIPTAHAAAFEAEAGEFNFGNDQEERRGGGSSSGTRVGSRNGGTPTGEVLGSSTSTPTGVVLGDATTTMPVGAPNTGAGGTTPVNVSLPTLVAILGTSARKSK